MDVPKGLGAGAHQRGRLWALKNEVIGFWKLACVYRYVHAYTCIPKNPNFDYLDGPTSNGHYSFNLSPNLAKFMFKLKSKMSTFK